MATNMKLMATLVFLFLPIIAGAYFNPGTPSGFISDFAGVLNASQKAQLEEKISANEKETSNEISVAIIKNLGGDYIENFSVKLFEDWKIGKTGKDNGVLVLIAVEDRKMRIEVGYGLEGALTDSQSSWIINNIMAPAFRSNDFYGGIDGAVDKIILATKGEYVPSGQQSNNSQNNFFDWTWLIFFFFIWIAGILGRSKSWWLGGVLGAIIGLVIGIIKGFVYAGIISVAVLTPLGLLFDFIVSRAYQKSKLTGHYPWWIGGSGFKGGSGSHLGGFGGGRSGGGGSSGSW